MQTMEKLTPEQEEEQKFLEQIEGEYQLSLDFMQSKRNTWLKRLKLFNNQSKKADKVGDPLLFTVFQTVYASLYDDRLQVAFEPNSRGDDDVAENLNDLAKYDYQLMQKAELDHDWIWDTCFFGRGLMLLHEFEREEDKMCPVPEVIDPLVWLRDPRAVSVNGDMRGRGSMRFGGREIRLTIGEMEEMEFEHLDELNKGNQSFTVSDEVRQARDEARGTSSTQNKEDALTESYEYNLLEWFTIRDGKKVVVTLGNDRKLVLKERTIKDRWPIYDRPLFPIAHDWDGVSIPDLIEDKQRARAIMINLGLDAAIADLHPMYLYNKKKIRNKRDLDFGFNKAVGVDGDTTGAYTPMQKANTVSQQVQNIFNILDMAAQKSVAAPEIAQGVSPRQERTLGEHELVASARGARMSLAAAIFGWSERKFWQQWYRLYKEHMVDDIDEKVIRIKGLLAPRWRVLRRENLIARIDPDVHITSIRVSEAEREREMMRFSRFYELAIQDPQSNRRFLNRNLARVLNLKSEDIKLIFPYTPDELLAESENELLNENKFVEGNHFDDHLIHIQIHNNANRTAATLAHIEFHKEMIRNQKEHPEAFPEQQQQQMQPELENSTPPTPTSSGKRQVSQAQTLMGQ